MTGTVRGETTLTGLRDVSVTAFTVAALTAVSAATTDAEAKYTLRVPRGSYRIRFLPRRISTTTSAAAIEHFQQWWMNATSASASALNVDRDVQGIDATLHAGYAILARVTVAGTGAGVQGMTCDLHSVQPTNPRQAAPGPFVGEQSEVYGFPDQSGRYVLILAPGTYEMRLLGLFGRYANPSPDPAKIEVRDRPVTGVDFVVQDRGPGPCPRPASPTPSPTPIPTPSPTPVAAADIFGFVM